MKFDRDIVFLDFEATGIDPHRDRIVQAALVRLTPAAERSRWGTLVNPETPIPAEATAIHHITDQMVAAAPKFRDIAPRLLEKLLDADIGGFGMVRYDLPLLSAECQRAGFAFSLEGRRVVDAQIIFHKMERRNLAAAHEFYCRKPLAGAHDAAADAEAALDVFLAQMGYYAPLGKGLPADLDGLHEFCSATDPKNVDPEGRFVWRNGEAAFNFGKYRTRSLKEILRLDPDYLGWLYQAGKMGPAVAAICGDALKGAFPKKPA